MIILSAYTYGPSRPPYVPFDVIARAVARGEHLGAEQAQRRRRVRAAASEVDVVDRLDDVLLRCVRVQVEVSDGVVAPREQADARPVGGDLEPSEHGLDVRDDDGEPFAADAARSVDAEDDVGASVAACRGMGESEVGVGLGGVGWGGVGWVVWGGVGWDGMGWDGVGWGGVGWSGAGGGGGGGLVAAMRSRAG